MKRFQADQVAPFGRLSGEIEQLHDAGCIQTLADNHDGKKFMELGVLERTKSVAYFTGIMDLTNNNPCIGCPAYKGGNCEAFKKYHSSHRISVEPEPEVVDPNKVGTRLYPGKTIAEIAKILGVSKSEVRRRKLKGEI